MLAVNRSDVKSMTVVQWSWSYPIFIMNRIGQDAIELLLASDLSEAMSELSDRRREDAAAIWYCC